MTGVIVNPQRGVAPGLTLDVWWDQIEYMHVVHKTTTTCSKIMQMPNRRARGHACLQGLMHAWELVCMVWHGIYLYGWLCISDCERFPLYGQCRSINNATLAEVKEACVSGSVEGEEEGERDSGRQREWGDGQMEGTATESESMKRNRRNKYVSLTVSFSPIKGYLRKLVGSSI